MVFGMLWSAGLVLHMCAYKWISAMTRTTPGSGSEDCCKNSVKYEKNNCYINVKVLFENVRVRPYPPFPTTLDSSDYKAPTNILIHAPAKISPDYSHFTSL